MKYEAQIARRSKIRIYSILLYLLILTFLIVFTFQMDIEEGTLILVYILITMGGFLFILMMMVYPYFRPLKQPATEQMDEKIVEVKEESYNETVMMWWVYAMTIPFLLIFPL